MTPCEPWRGVARTRLPASASVVTWRDGVHLTGTPIWCDARRAARRVLRVVGAIASARAGHGQLIATPTTLALLGARPATATSRVPLRQPFTLGTLRLELVPSGRGLGAAALHVDIGGRARAVRRRDAHDRRARLADAAEVRACDALVVARAVRRAAPRRSRRVDDAAAQLDRVGARAARGRSPPVLVVDTRARRRSRSRRGSRRRARDRRRRARCATLRRDARPPRSRRARAPRQRARGDRARSRRERADAAREPTRPRSSRAARSTATPASTPASRGRSPPARASCSRGSSRPRARGLRHRRRRRGDRRRARPARARARPAAADDAVRGGS